MANMKKTTMALGKLPAEFLQKLIAKLPFDLDSSVKIPPGVGLDAAGLKIGNKLVAVTTDPITLATNDLGMYSVSVNINDVVCLGCKPRWYSATLLLPFGITQNKVAAIWRDLSLALKRYHVSAIGGHTEVTKAVNVPIIIGQMIGEATDGKLLDARNCSQGDQILLWRDLAIEGTALIAREKEKTLSKHFAKGTLKKMQNLLYNPGICILPLAEKLLPAKGVVAIHDPTEGGVATSLHELADIAKCGLRINGDAIKIMPETLKLAELLNFNPLGLISSGNALIVCKKQYLNSIMEKLRSEPISIIGEFTKEMQRVIDVKGKSEKLPKFTKDEIVRLSE